ncbi:unnamed protein product [Trichobilharzia regenti]|nr:unnamed protein product [Trichobilharzia regenti]
MNTSEGLVQPTRSDFKESWLSPEIGEKISLLWSVLEELQKRAKEVDTYDGSSIKNAISDLENGVEKCEVRLNGLAHELERLRIILKPSDPDYLGQLEDGFRDACRAATEATQSLKIRKLVLKKHSKIGAYLFAFIKDKFQTLKSLSEKMKPSCNCSNNCGENKQVNRKWYPQSFKRCTHAFLCK